MPLRQELVSSIEHLDFGLRCPDGTIIWPPDAYQGYGFSTAEERNALPGFLRGIAAHVRIPEDMFLASFGWVARTTTTTAIARTNEDAVLGMNVQWPDESSIDAEPAVSTPNE